MSEHLPELAKRAALARADLGEKLAVCAGAIAQIAEIMSAAAELAEASATECAATAHYQSALEAELSRQNSLS